MKLPEWSPGSDIVCPDIAELSARLVELRSNVALPGAIEVRSNQKQVLVYCRSTVIWYRQTDFPFPSESRIHLAGFGIQCHHFPAGCKNDSRRIVAISGPIADPAERRQAVIQLVGPEFLSRFGFERHNAVACRQIHRTIHDDGCNFLVKLKRTLSTDRFSRPVERVEPSPRQSRDVGCIDLVERRVARPLQVVKNIGQSPSGRGVLFCAIPAAIRVNDSNGILRWGSFISAHNSTLITAYARACEQRQPNDWLVTRLL